MKYTASEFKRFVILLEKVPQVETTRETIQRHIDHLKKLDHERRLELCGPFTDHPSGIVIVRAETKEEAIAIAESDPFVIEGVRTFEVRSLLMACSENNYLLS